MCKACALQSSRPNHTYVKSKIFPEHKRANPTEIVGATAQRRHRFDCVSKLKCDRSRYSYNATFLGLQFFASLRDHKAIDAMETANESTYNRPKVDVSVDSPRRDFHRSTACYLHRYGICTQRRSLSIRILSGTTIPTSA